ncbi:MAG: NAD-dependent epimerase/dehydratase family protein [Anaerolineae bacterium]
MRKQVTLVTGASGEMGQALIEHLTDTSSTPVLALDIKPLPPEIERRAHLSLVGDILDHTLLDRLVTEYAIPRIFHLAALLSTRAEFNPEAAHRVNVDGTLNLLRLAVEQSGWLGEPVVFMFPSSVAVYGLPDLPAKTAAGAVSEKGFMEPTTMNGCNKLYGETLGRYYANFYRQLSAGPERGVIDFRAIRFPGLISAFTLPTGGTSDYAPEMVHAAAQGEPYACFVRPDTRIPFMAMPDAVKALVDLQAAERAHLTSHVYNVTSFSPSAEDVADLVQDAFPAAQITYHPDEARQSIVDSWPADQDDSLARRDWGWQPAYTMQTTFDDYLVPNIARRYAR